MICKKIFCMKRLKKAICRVLLPIVARWENRLWKVLYQRPRRYCVCVSDKEFAYHVKNNMPNKDQFND